MCVPVRVSVNPELFRAITHIEFKLKVSYFFSSLFCVCGGGGGGVCVRGCSFWPKSPQQLLWNCSPAYAKEHLWWLVNIGSGNGLVPWGNKIGNQCWPGSMSLYGVTRPQWMPVQPCPSHTYLDAIVQKSYVEILLKLNISISLMNVLPIEVCCLQLYVSLYRLHDA